MNAPDDSAGPQSAPPPEPGPAAEPPQGTRVPEVAPPAVVARGAHSYSADRWAHRRGEPRTFAAAWIFFLVAATTVSIGTVGLFGLVSTDVYRPAAKVMLMIVAAGVVLLWPMVRLSQEAPAKPLRSIGVDLIILIMPVQAVVWPQSLSWMAAWPVEVAGALAALIAAWAVLVGGMIATYLGTVERGVNRAGGPWLMMAVIILVVTVGPLIVALNPRIAAGPDVQAWLMSSPLTGVFNLTRDRSWSGMSAFVDGRQWSEILITGSLGLVTWGIAWAVQLARGRRAA
jgi:hypothetical protein